MEKTLDEKKIFAYPESLKKTVSHYCPGCGHGVAHRIVCETIDELGIRETTVGIAPVGCAVLIYDYIDIDMLEAAHGRAPAVATGVKRAQPDKTVFTYQGDGDLVAIGTNEIVHAANRGENITVVFINNAIYGMTGGQMAPTTLVGQKTTTTPFGRNIANEGYPIRACELLSTLEGVYYCERIALNNVAGVVKAKKAVKKAFQNQLDKKGFSFVELLSACPTGWSMSPVEALDFINNEMVKVFPPGVFKDKDVAK
ncbi:MAG: 2-oxoglutarate oxidoreductase [Planctomycetes bacterium]|nr:2-oxoglutarate oxidoreductase [Planctomycetota bacterium]